MYSVIFIHIFFFAICLSVRLSQVFEKVPGLLFLYMERNQLKEVPDDLPAGLEQLRLSHNQISKIPSGAFGKMEHLALLDLHHNKVHTHIHASKHKHTCAINQSHSHMCKHTHASACT